MKKIIGCILFLCISSLFAQEMSEIPAAKRPRPVDKEKAAAAAEKDESKDDEENFRNTIRYGIPSEISDLLDDLIKKEDPRFTEEIYDLFESTKSSAIKERVLKYFTKIEDPCVEDFAVEILIDPYDQKNDLVKACFSYVGAVKTKEAVQPVLKLLESENENYFNDALSTIGEIGGPSEAVYITELLDRDDLTEAQRQALMRTCGKIHAVETWDKLVEILHDKEENTFIRMYAAEALGLMKVEKSVPELVEAYDENDANLRQYVIKGLSNFPDVVEAKATILQAVRDEHWKVRQESIKSVKELKLEEAVPFLIYRAKNDSENVIKNESYSTLAALNTKEGNDFLIEQVSSKKTGDATKKKVVEVLLKENHAGHKEIIELADKIADDDTRKDLRYAVGKELSKYSNNDFAPVCLKFLSSKDTTTINLGLDMYKTGKYGAVEGKMQSLYNEKKTNSAVKARIKKLLDLPDEEDKKPESK